MSWGAVAGAVVGGVLANNAAGKAADGQTAAAGTAAAEQGRQFDLMRRDQAPWLNVGTNAIYRLGDLLGIGGRPLDVRSQADWRTRLLPRFTTGTEGGVRFTDNEGNTSFRMPDGSIGSGSSVDEAGLNAAIARRMEQERRHAEANQQRPGDFGMLMDRFDNGDFKKDPGYDFRMAEGEKAIERAAKARGMYYAPSTVKELVRYGQGFASNEFGNAYNRHSTDRTRIYNMLTGVSGGGQTAANQVGNAGMNMATNVGNLMTGAANARGAAGIAGANAFGGAANTIGNWYRQQQMMNQMFPQGGGNQWGSAWQPFNQPGYYGDME